MLDAEGTAVLIADLSATRISYELTTSITMEAT